MCMDMYIMYVLDICTHTHTQTHMCVFIASFFSIEDGAGFRGSGFVGLRSLGIDSPFGEGYCCVT